VIALDKTEDEDQVEHWVVESCIDNLVLAVEARGDYLIHSSFVSVEMKHGHNQYSGWQQQQKLAHMDVVEHYLLEHEHW
jgi:phosphoribosylformimino-5-aminoimidazole carboxamide ribonucleotide (ProFAR) isomerase